MTVNNKYKEFVKKLDEKSNSNSDNYDLTETLDSLCKKIENRFKAISHEYNEEPVSNVKINNNIIKKKESNY